MALGERGDRREALGWLNPLAVHLRAVFPQGSDELFDLPDGLARDLLDDPERLAGCGRVALGLQAPRARVDQDHVDRMARGVMEVTCDASALLGCRQPPLALGFAFRTDGAVLELGDPLGTKPRPVAGQPRAAPEQGAEQQLGARETVVRHPEGS